MNNSTAAIRITVAGSLVAYAMAEWLRMRAGGRGAVTARRWWTVALLLSVVHTVVAFHYRYHWSHAAAAADGAAQIAALTGRSWAWAPFVNYAFLALWTADTARWWRRGAAAARDALRAAMSALVLFMFVNGAIVFAHGPIRGLGAAATIAVLTAWLLREPRFDT